MEELLPCPFCGTRLDDPNNPGSEIQGGGYTFECGSCGANWPLLKRETVKGMAGDGDIVAFFNRRATQEAPAHD